MLITFANRFKKPISCLLIFLLIGQIITPSIVVAVPSGPLSTDASSFEPVDTTDMVNPLTGDLVYNLPLIEIPGPEGGYPMSLSYHAGIQLNEESSWVGLGWTLNPGAINRIVNGFPDDWGAIGASRRDYWEGGVTNTTNIGLTIPISGTVGAALGLTFANDTYMGFGLGGYLGVTLSPQNSPFSASIGIGISPYGGGAQLFGGIGIGDISGSVGLDFSLDTKSGAGVGVSARSFGMGISLASNQGFSYSLPGISSTIQNSNAGEISKEINSKSINLILFSFKNQKTRYWSDETQNSNLFGSLDQFSTFGGFEIPDNQAYDNYAIVEQSWDAAFNRPEKQQGGAFPNYDSYQVSAQGLGGVMRPYRFTGELHQQNIIERQNANSRVKTVGYVSNTISPYPNFRFEGDFSNSYNQPYRDYANANLDIVFNSAPFDGPIADAPDWYNGYLNGELIGSRYISYFTTKLDGTINIVDANKKFITPVAKGLVRNAHTSKSKYPSHIAGFSITNESGVTYHYNLPAYAYDEEIYQERINQAQGLMFNRQTKSEGYAYTWYLTAITGPDYVDRGAIGALDEEDYGYWVSFEYGKWSDQFVWRNPSEGYTSTEDGLFKTVAMGKKEIYYLNAIKTRTHTAIFEKNVREDGKGASPEVFNKNWSSQNGVSTNYQNEGIFNQNSSQSMRLERMYLLNNVDASFVATNSGGAGTYIPTGRTIPCSSCELHMNIVDKNDVDAVGRSALESRAIKVIDFAYDYTLSKGVPTSYPINTPTVKNGKLTLNAVTFRGKGGQSFLPPIEFAYGLTNEEIVKGSGSVAPTAITNVNRLLKLGDLVETDETNPVFCGVVVGITQSGSTYNYNVTGGNVSSGLGVRNIRTTKNPPYDRNRYDLWGMYKSDYIATGGGRDNMKRVVSAVSNESNDVWSLRTVKTSLGALIKMNYEGHTYSKVSYARNHSFLINNFNRVSGDDYYFDITTDGNSAVNFFKVNDKLDMLLFRRIGSSTYYYNTLKSESFGEPIVTSVIGNRVYITMNSYFTNNLMYNGQTAPVILTGNVSPYALNRYYGGGVRVKSIEVDNLAGTKSVTQYEYNLDNGLSSGTTTYEPIGIEFEAASGFTSNTQVLNEYRNELNAGLSRLLPFSREIPGPSVMYEYVTISSYSRNNNADQFISPTKNRIQFEVFHTGRALIQNITPTKTGSDGSRDYATRNMALKKFLASIGNIKSISKYNGDNQLLSKTVNHYLHDDLAIVGNDFFTQYEQRLANYRRQGLLKERFAETKSVWNGSRFVAKATMTARESYPMIKLGTSVYDYVNNTVVTDMVKGYDFYNGQVVESIQTDAYGNRVLTKITPAYKVYAEMGLKNYGEPNKKSMLTQIAASYQYKIDANNAMTGLISANVTQWGKNAPVIDPAGELITQNTAALGNVWRETASYSWLPTLVTADGVTPIAQFADFNFSNPAASNTNWKKTNGMNLYNVYSKVVETTDINNQYSAQRYGYNNSKVVMSGFPSGYYELAFGSAEDETINGTNATNVLKGDGVVTTAAAHTGTASLRLASTRSGFTYTVPSYNIAYGRPYVASVWVRPTSGTASDVKLYYQINGVTKVTSGSSAVSNKKSGDWTLVTLEINGSDIVEGAILKVACRNDHTTDVYVDDFRFQPKVNDARAYVYDKQTGDLTYVLDNNNLFTRYEYDVMGNLKAVYAEQFGRNPFKVGEYQIHYRSVN